MQTTINSRYTHYQVPNAIGTDHVKCLQNIKCTHENRLLNQPCPNEPRCLTAEATPDMVLTIEEEDVTCPACNHLLNQEAAAWR